MKPPWSRVSLRVDGWGKDGKENVLAAMLRAQNANIRLGIERQQHKLKIGERMREVLSDYDYTVDMQSWAVFMDSGTTTAFIR